MADAGAARHRLFRALLELIERLSVAVVVVEDAHWADTATLEWLLVLATAGNEGLSVVVTDRPGDVPESSLLPQIASRLSAGRVTQRITLGGLDVAQTRRLVGSMVAGGDVSERFAVFLHQRTDGVPLAVQESMLLLRDRHDIVRRGGELTRRVIEELNLSAFAPDGATIRVYPGAGYYFALGGGLAAALGLVAATLPVLHRMTKPEEVRFE
jgi:hypothetical protein